MFTFQEIFNSSLFHLKDAQIKINNHLLEKKKILTSKLSVFILWSYCLFMVSHPLMKSHVRWKISHNGAAKFIRPFIPTRNLQFHFKTVIREKILNQWEKMPDNLSRIDLKLLLQGFLLTTPTGKWNMLLSTELLHHSSAKKTVWS